VPAGSAASQGHGRFGSGHIKIDTAAFKKKLGNPAMALNKWKKFHDPGDGEEGK
jgi:hypothetical protein